MKSTNLDYLKTLILLRKLSGALLKVAIFILSVTFIFQAI